MWVNFGFAYNDGGEVNRAHAEDDLKISLVKDGGEPVIVSQFMMQLQRLKTVERKDPPMILHFHGIQI